MNTPIKTAVTMVPISGRVPEDLYQWLATASLEGATTVSDKLRVAVSTLKRIQDGDSDYLGALQLFRDMSRSTRERIASLEQTRGHSEVLAAIAEHAPALNALLTSAQIGNEEHARQLEAQLVQRSMQLAEALLKQGLLSQANAFDPKVIADHGDRLLELLQLLNRQHPMPRSSHV